MLQISFARPVDAVQTYSMGAIVETLYLIAKTGRWIDLGLDAKERC